MVKKVNLENQKFIIIFYETLATSPQIISVKRDMKEYADHLGWTVTCTSLGLYRDKKSGEEDNYYSIKITPKGNKISPKEIFENLDIHRGFVRAMFEDILHKKFPNKPKISHIIAGKGNKIWTKSHLEHVYFQYYPLKEAVELQRRNPEMSKEIFLIDFFEWYKDMKKQLKKKTDNKEAEMLEGRLLKIFK